MGRRKPRPEAPLRLCRSRRVSCQSLERVGLHLSVEPNANHLLFDRQPVVCPFATDDAWVRSAVVGLIGIESHIARVDVEHQGLPVLRAPTTPGGLLRQHLLEVVTDQRSVERLTGEVAPQRAGLAVEHDERVADQLAGHAKGEGLAVYFSGIHDARVTKWSPGDGDVRPTQAIVDDLDLAHDGDWIGMRLASDLDTDDVQALSHR